MAVLSIPITKAGNRPIEVDTQAVPDDMYNLALAEGLKVLLNKGMSKVPAAKGLEGKDLEDVKESAYLIAQANFAKLQAGQLRSGRAAATTASGAKVPGVVMTEARRLAKEVVKNEIRAAGMKISHVDASVITKAANELIAADPSFIEMAQANIEARTAKVVVGADEAATKAAALARLAELGGVEESPKLIAKAAAAKKDKPLSAKQAGKVAPRKPQATPQSHPHHAN